MQTTNVLDHAKSDMHVHAMNLLRRDQARAQASSIATYAPIAQSLHVLSEDEHKMKLFPFLMDGSTDQGNVENELLLVLWGDPEGKDEKIHTRISYLCILKPQHATAEGLLESLRHGQSVCNQGGMQQIGWHCH